uniref:Uncharacterized protein n=1 Tax=Glycine max TaxID=3847 RepID=C6TLS5_SOYBN|nr:unknown [Glycine max]
MCELAVNSATQSFVISMNGLREAPSLSFPPNVTRLCCNRTTAHVHFSFSLELKTQKQVLPETLILVLFYRFLR